VPRQPSLLVIPPEPLGRFVLGEITIRQLGRICGVDQTASA
jgi:hypothetical protein